MIIGNQNINVGWISGMPRSGTTWLSQIFASCPEVRLKNCPLFSYEFKNFLNENSSAEGWKKLFFLSYQTSSEFLDQEHLRKNGLVPSFDRRAISPSHLLIKSNRFHNLVPIALRLVREIKFVHIVRNPCATIYSWLTDPGEFPRDADPMSEWRTGKCRKSGPGEFWGFDDWVTVTQQAMGLSDQYPNRHHLIRYEDLVRHPLVVTKQLFEFFDLPLTDQTRDFLRLSQTIHNDDKHSVFKIPSAEAIWERELDPRIVAVCFSELEGTRLEQFLSKY